MCELGSDGERVAGDLLKAVKTLDVAMKTDMPPMEHYFIGKPSNSSVKIRTAVFSRHLISDEESLASFPEGFAVDVPRSREKRDGDDKWVPIGIEGYSRPVSKVRINPDEGRPFNLFVVHFKSKRPKDGSIADSPSEPIGRVRSAIMRNMEAAALRYHLDDFLMKQYASNPKTPSLVVGDFNDAPTSVPAETMIGAFDKNLKPNFVSKSRQWTENSQRALVNCARLHMRAGGHEDALYSYIFNERYTLIDHAFVTMHWARKLRRMEMYNDHVQRHRLDTRKTAAAKRWKSDTSDHGYFVLDFSGV